MKPNALYIYMYKQIPVMIILSLFPGLGYILLGWLNDIYVAALYWYLGIVLLSLWGYVLYRSFDLASMSEVKLASWYRNTRGFFYLFFLFWLIIFLIYSPEIESGMHYIAIFTEIGASTVAATLLFPDKRLYKPVILTLIIPLAIYFAMIETWYSEILAIFAGVFGWVLLYSATSSNNLFTRSNYQATHDYLTGLFNRQYCIESLQKKMNTLKESSQFSYLLLIDLDHFKTVNDSLGHDIGDELLREVVRRIQSLMSDDKMVARLGGDEFIITGENFENKDVCKHLAMELSEKLLAKLKETYIVQNHHLYISASIGVSLIEDSGHTAVDFIKEADIAMYEVKAKGRDGVFFFDDTMSGKVEENLRLERLLHFAVDKDQIELVYQPQLNHQGRVVGVEALVRWTSEEVGTISPAEFIPIAEKTGLIIELGRHIVRKAFQALVEWDSKNIQLEKVSINISMRQFMHYSFVADVEALCREYLSDSLMRKITFEITESVAAEDLNRVIAIIHELKNLGVRFSMDDFGTGYSSLSYIQQLPIDEIKIDRLFIKELTLQASAEEMVNTILSMARIFDLEVVAEGVETPDQRQFLEQHGCRLFQGFLFSEPLSKAAFEAYWFSSH
jgi:diguanylate cyclase (GGDEF)-like protein